MLLLYCRKVRLVWFGMHLLHRRQVLRSDRGNEHRDVRSLRGWNLLWNDGGNEHLHMHGLYRWKILWI